MQHFKRPLSRLAQSFGPFFGPEEEFACPDEEECEIDWDLMPGFDDDDSDEIDKDKEETQAVAVSSSSSLSSFGSQALASLEKGRVRLEMNWQIDECETHEDTCSDFCQDCAGSGVQPCRFCRGTRVVAFGNDFRSCIICKHGQEQCASCRGTGRIAPWVTTMDKFLNHGPSK